MCLGIGITNQPKGESALKFIQYIGAPDVKHLNDTL